MKYTTEDLVAGFKANEDAAVEALGEFRAIPMVLLLAIANGRVDAQTLARHAIADCGLDTTGAWVGFQQAAKEWGVN